MDHWKYKYEMLYKGAAHMFLQVAGRMLFISQILTNMVTVQSSKSRYCD